MSTVLAVDDEEDILQMIEDYLVPEGYRVIKARDGREALQLALQWKPDLIFLDIQMPVMDGFAVLEILRGNKAIARTPVVMLTAQGQTHNILRAEGLKTLDYLIKPFSFEEILTVVHNAIP